MNDQGLFIHFFFVSVWFGLSTILSQIVLVYNLNYFYYYIIWIGCFAFSLLIFLKPIISMRKIFRDRLSKSISWPLIVKLTNGLAWALPFMLIPFFYKYYPFLLLAGLSLGNISTFIFLKRYSQLFSVEQLITGSLLLSSLLFVALYYNYMNDYEWILFSSRIMISISYGIGGLVGYFKNTDKNITSGLH